MDEVPRSQAAADTGSKAYTKQFTLDHPEQDKATAAADAVLVVGEFCKLVLE